MQRRKVRRRRPKVGYARGEAKRAHILNAAIKTFGHLGYDAASTRTIARGANVPLTAIQYYFGSKNELYRACDEHIVEQISGPLYPLLTSYEGKCQNNLLDSAGALDAICSILDAIADLLLAPKRSDDWVEFVIRAEHTSANHPNTKLEALKRRLLQCLIQLIARALNMRASDPSVAIRAVAAYGSVAIFRISHGITLDTIGWKDFGGTRCATVKRVLNEQLRAALGMRSTAVSGASLRKAARRQ